MLEPGEDWTRAEIRHFVKVVEAPWNSIEEGHNTEPEPPGEAYRDRDGDVWLTEGTAGTFSWRIEPDRWADSPGFRHPSLEFLRHEYGPLTPMSHTEVKTWRTGA